MKQEETAVTAAAICAHKRSFDTYDQALQSAIWLKKNKQRRMIVYHCKLCDCYHLADAKRKAEKARRRKKKYRRHNKGRTNRR